MSQARVYLIILLIFVKIYKMIQHRIDEHRFGKCLSFGEFHLRNSCVFRHAKCFKYGIMGYIKQVSITAVRFSISDDKPCGSNFINLGVSDDHFSLSTILKGNLDIQRRLHTFLGLFHYFVVDTAIIEFIISSKDLESLDSDVVVRPAKV